MPFLNANPKQYNAYCRLPESVAKFTKVFIFSKQ